MSDFSTPMMPTRYAALLDGKLHNCEKQDSFFLAGGGDKVVHDTNMSEVK